MPAVTAGALAVHLEQYPVTTQELDDETGRDAVKRPARLVFTTATGHPVTRSG